MLTWAMFDVVGIGNNRLSSSSFREITSTLIAGQTRQD